MAIQLHRRPEGRAPFPSQKRLADMCHTSIDTVRRALDELAAAGILKTQNRHRADGGNSTLSYSLHVPPISTGAGGVPGTDAGAPIGTDATAEVEEKQEVEKSGRSVKQQERDEIWEALSTATGVVPASASEKSNFGKCVTELLDAGGTPNEIATRARRWPMRYPGATLTARALCVHWGALASGRRVGRVSADEIREMGQQ